MAGEARRDACHSSQSVEQLLGLKRLYQGAGEVGFVIAVGFVGHGRNLVGARVQEGAKERTQIESMVDEILGERIQQGSVAGRIGSAEIVVRLNDAAAKQVIPDAIDLSAREKW